MAHFTPNHQSIIGHLVFKSYSLLLNGHFTRFRWSFIFPYTNSRRFSRVYDMFQAFVLVHIPASSGFSSLCAMHTVHGLLLGWVCICHNADNGNYCNGHCCLVCLQFGFIDAALVMRTFSCYISSGSQTEFDLLTSLWLRTCLLGFLSLIRCLSLCLLAHCSIRSNICSLLSTTLGTTECRYTFFSLCEIVI